MTEQLPLALPHRPALGRADFIVTASNANAVAEIERWACWPNARLALIGPNGAGKTHLAHVFSTLTGAAHLSDLAALPVAAPVVIEDAASVAGNAAAEEALFHHLNARQIAGAATLLTGVLPPARWSVALPDLASRLEATAIAEIAAPDDGLLSALLAKLFHDRGIRCSPPTLSYIAQRIERSHAAARAVVARIDRLSLAEGREVTRALAARAL